MGKSVVILGTGRTLSKFNQEEFSGSEIWATGSAFNLLKDSGINVDTYFCLHKNETIEFNGDVIDQTNYPLDRVMKEFDSRFFTNSISYMIAFALLDDVDSISLFGVDMDSENEYEFERPSVTYWVGFARGLSKKVTLASDIDNPLFLYGFEPYSPLIVKLKERMDYSLKMAKVHQELGDMKKSDQFLGQYYDNKYWIRELRG